MWCGEEELIIFLWTSCVRAQSCLTLCHSMDCSLLGSSVHGILQARILEWAAISSSIESSWPRDRTCVSRIGKWILYHWATWEALSTSVLYFLGTSLLKAMCIVQILFRNMSYLFSFLMMSFFFLRCIYFLAVVSLCCCTLGPFVMEHSLWARRLQ